MKFPRQEWNTGHWSGLVFSSPGDLPNPGIEPTSPAWQVDSISLCHLESPYIHIYSQIRVCISEKLFLDAGRYRAKVIKNKENEKLSQSRGD